MSLDPAWIALIATVCGGVGLKIVESWLGRSRVRINDATQIRDELRTSVTELRAENRLIETDRDSWRDKYYATLEKLIRLRTYAQTHGLDPPEDD